MINKISIMIMIMVLLPHVVAGQTSSRFEDIEKPPDGARQGQMMLGALLSVGGTLGPLVEGEETFIDKSIYEVIPGTYKYIDISHISFNAGIWFEYMPIDHLGVRAKLKGDFILQRTLFGAQYENWSLNMYRGMTIMAGPAVHVTTRKRWDVVINPSIGYSFGGLTIAPVASELISSSLSNQVNEELIHLFALGAEVSMMFYFSGGFVLSFGFDWNMYMFQRDNTINITNNNSGRTVSYPQETEVSWHNLSFIVSAGYAFAN